jgi:hypothetical protein
VRRRYGKNGTLEEKKSKVIIESNSTSNKKEKGDCPLPIRKKATQTTGKIRKRFFPLRLATVRLFADRLGDESNKPGREVESHRDRSHDPILLILHR